MIVIAAALSIQDPRERPADQRDAGRRSSHARFADDDSDFLALPEPVALPARAAARAVGQPVPQALQGRVPAPPARARVAGPRRAAAPGGARRRGSRATATPAEPDEIHRALLAGLLSHVGLRDAARREYVGARDARFALFPGSALAPQAAAVGDGRRARRDVAAVRARPPRGSTRRGSSRSPSTSSSARTPSRAGTASAAQVVATERVTLYGLPIVAGPDGRRTGAIDPDASRELFIRRALVEGDWDTRHAFVAENRRRVEEVEALEERTRRRDLLADDAALLRVLRRARPGRRRLRRALRPLVARRAPHRPGPAHVPARAAAARGAPTTRRPPGRVAAGRPRRCALQLPLRARRRATTASPCTCRCEALAQLRAGRLRLARARRCGEELVTALIRGAAEGPAPPARARCPTSPRRSSPACSRAAARCVDAVARELARVRGVRVAARGVGPAQAAAAPADALPRRGRATARCSRPADDLDALRAELRPRLRAELARGGAERSSGTGLRAWRPTSSTLPRTVALPGTGQAVRAYPALVDEGATVGVRVLDTPAAAGRGDARRHAPAAPARRVPSPVRWVQGRLSQRGAARAERRAARQRRRGARRRARRRARRCSSTRAAARRGTRRRSRGCATHVAGVAGRDDARGRRAGRRGPRRRARRAAPHGVADRRAARSPRSTTSRASSAACSAPASSRGPAPRRLPDVERYLRARRAPPRARCPTRRRATADRMRGDPRARGRVPRRLDAWPRGRPLPDALREVPWMLEELRVSHFAQGLGTRGPVSSKRIRRVLDEA